MFVEGIILSFVYGLFVSFGNGLLQGNLTQELLMNLAGLGINIIYFWKLSEIIKTIIQ
jgi:hypothetical protein